MNVVEIINSISQLSIEAKKSIMWLIFAIIGITSIVHVGINFLGGYIISTKEKIETIRESAALKGEMNLLTKFFQQQYLFNMAFEKEVGGFDEHFERIEDRGNRHFERIEDHDLQFLKLDPTFKPFTAFKRGRTKKPKDKMKNILKKQENILKELENTKI